MGRGLSDASSNDQEAPVSRPNVFSVLSQEQKVPFKPSNPSQSLCGTFWIATSSIQSDYLSSFFPGEAPPLYGVPPGFHSACAKGQTPPLLPSWPLFLQKAVNSPGFSCAQQRAFPSPLWGPVLAQQHPWGGCALCPPPERVNESLYAVLP